MTMNVVAWPRHTQARNRLATWATVSSLAFAAMHFAGVHSGYSSAYLLVGIAALQVAAGTQRRTIVPRRRGRAGGGQAGAAQDVVLIAYHYPPHNEVGAWRPYRFARYLRKLGIEVAVICSSSALRRSTDQQALAEAAAETPAPQRVPGPDAAAAASWLDRRLHTLQRLFMPYNDRLGWLPHAYTAAARAMTGRSVIVSTHPPVVTHMTALALKLRFDRPWVADFRDPLWGNPCRTSRRAAIMDPLIERLIVCHADAVIANTDTAASVLRKRYPGRAHKIHTIWNGFDPADAITPVPRPARDHLVVSHVGTLYGARTPLPFLRCLERLAVNGAVDPDRLQFRQIGRFDPECFDVERAALPHLIAHSCMYHSSRHMPRHEARQEMLEADVLLLLDVNVWNPGLQVPAKTYEYVRTGRPILALTVPGSATEHVLGLADVPHLCVDITAPATTIDAQVLAFLSRQHVSTAPSLAFARKFSANGQVQALLSILESIDRPGFAEPACPAAEDEWVADTPWSRGSHSI